MRAAAILVALVCSVVGSGLQWRQWIRWWQAGRPVPFSQIPIQPASPVLLLVAYLLLWVAS